MKFIKLKAINEDSSTYDLYANTNIMSLMRPSEKYDGKSLVYYTPIGFILVDINFEDLNALISSSAEVKNEYIDIDVKVQPFGEKIYNYNMLVGGVTIFFDDKQTGKCQIFNPIGSGLLIADIDSSSVFSKIYA